MAQLKGSMSHVLTPWNDLWPSYNSNCIQSENVLEENISAEHMNNSSCLQRYKSGSWDLLQRSSVLSVYIYRSCSSSTLLRVTTQRTISLRTTKKKLTRCYELLKDPALSETQVNSITKICLRIQKE